MIKYVFIFVYACMSVCIYIHSEHTHTHIHDTYIQTYMHTRTGIEPASVRAFEVMVASAFVAAALAFGFSWIQYHDGNVPIKPPSVRSN